MNELVAGEDEAKDDSNKLETTESLREIEDQIETIEPELLNDLSPQQRKRVTSFVMKVTSHKGPLPSPETLKQYNEVIPDLAERLVVLVEQQAEHRKQMELADAAHARKIDDKLVTEQLGFPKRGQIIAAGLALFIISVGSYMIMHGFPTEGLSLIGGTVVSLAGIFVLGKYLENDESKKEE